MPWVAAATIGGAVLGFAGQSSAADAAEEQANRNRADQSTWNKQQDPFSSGGNRTQYVGQLNQLMQGGIAGVASDPAYQRFNAKSQEDLQRQLSAKGMGVSGQEMVALGQNNQNNMLSYFNQQYDRLSELSGARRGGGQALQGMSPGDAYNMQANQFQQAGNILGSLGSIYGGGNNSNPDINTPTPTYPSTPNPNYSLTGMGGRL